MKKLPYNITLSEILRTFKRKLKDEPYTDAAHYFIEATNTINKGKFWFRMFKGDTWAWTIKDVLGDAALPARHRNHLFLTDSIDLAIAEPEGIEVYKDQ
jgi:hypothetical protein